MTISDSFLGLFFVSTSFSFTTCVCVILFIFFLPDFLLGNQKKNWYLKKEGEEGEKSDNDLEESVIGHTRNFCCKEHSPVGVGGGGTLVSFDTYGSLHSFGLLISRFDGI